MPRDTVRFSFTIPTTEPVGLTSGGWRLWTQAEDTYLTTKGLGSTRKVSLHADEAWRLAIPKENFAKVAPVVMPGATDRAPWTFTPTPFVDGVRLAFAIVTTRAALIPGPLSPGSHIAVEDRWNRAYRRLRVDDRNGHRPRARRTPRRWPAAAGLRATCLAQRRY